MRYLHPYVDLVVAVGAGAVLTLVAIELEFRRSIYKRRLDFLRYGWLR